MSMSEGNNGRFSEKEVRDLAFNLRELSKKGPARSISNQSYAGVYARENLRRLKNSPNLEQEGRSAISIRPSEAQKLLRRMGSVDATQE